MNKEDIEEVVGIIAESRRPGDLVLLSIGSIAGDDRISITSAPSYVLDAVSDNGYHLKAEYGSVVVMAEEG